MQRDIAADFYHPSTTMTHHYVALDSWRGLCALLVAIFHFLPLVQSHVSDSAFLHHAALFVDFFFVLSGFVIAGNYGERLGSFPAVQRFVWLRLGRLYPLHVVLLGVLVLFQLPRVWVHGGFGGAVPVFSGEENLPAILLHLTLLQGFPLQDRLTWNIPSWSIGLEFYVYIVFALMFWLGRRYRWWLVAAGAAGCSLVTLALSDTPSGYTAMLRCLCGFMAGALCWKLHSQQRTTLLRSKALATAIELATLAAVLVFVTQADTALAAAAAPAVFGVVVLVFAQEAGAVNHGLTLPALARLGAWSYSIYMVHFLVQLVLEGSLVTLQRQTGLVLHRTDALGHADKAFGLQLWQGDLLMLLMLALVIATAALTYRTIEVPARDWFKRQDIPRRSNTPIPVVIAKES